MASTLFYFISHMVQMKGFPPHLPPWWPKADFISHMVQMKAVPNTYNEFMRLTFISHMVQMKVCLELHVRRLLSPLYPTWFRWKILLDTQLVNTNLAFISHMVQMKVYLQVACFLSDFLYIPHGSDESLQWTDLYVYINYFISHMVQMKGEFVLYNF